MTIGDLHPGEHVRTVLVRDASVYRIGATVVLHRFAGATDRGTVSVKGEGAGDRTLAIHYFGPADGVGHDVGNELLDAAARPVAEYAGETRRAASR